MTRFVPELPPGKSPGGRSKGAYEGFRKDCRKNPGVWAVFPGSVGGASQIRAGATNFLSVWHGFECAQRVLDGKPVLYVRYNPGGSVPEEAS